MQQTETKREYRYVEHQEVGNHIELSLSCHPFNGEGQWAEDQNNPIQAAQALLEELEQNSQTVVSLKEIGHVCKIIGFDAFHAWRDEHPFEEVIISYDNNAAPIYGGDRNDFNGGRTFIKIRGEQHYSLYRLSR